MHELKSTLWALCGNLLNPPKNAMTIFSSCSNRMSAALAVLVVLCPNPSPAQQTDSGGASPDFVFDEGDVDVPADVIEGPLAYDGDVVSVEGRLWCTWLEFIPGEGDVVWVAVRDEGDWQSRRKFIAEPGDFAAPSLTVDRTGRVWLSYEARTDGDWNVWLVAVEDGAPRGEPVRISPGHGTDLHHHAVSDDTGGLWIVWQSDGGAQFDVVARRVVNGEPGEVHQVDSPAHSAWHPRAGVDAAGNLHVAWDAVERPRTTFHVFLRSFRDGEWNSTVPVAETAAFEGRVDLAADSAGRVWIAWEEGGEQWGWPFRGIDTQLLRDHHGPLHRHRALRLAVLDADGTLHRLEDPLPMPSVRRARRRPDLPPGTERTGAFYERCRLTVDEQDRLWIVYRHYYTPWLSVAHRSHVEDGWGVYARCYTSDGWSPLHRMRIGQGDGLQRLSIARRADGIAALWTTGRTHRTNSTRPRGLAFAKLTADGRPPRDPPLARVPQATNARPAASTDFRRPHSVGGTEYRVYYGDLHRHTDLSLCRVPIDGTIDDAYRYAIEVSKLDFLGITDHARDIAQGNPLSQLWWRSRKEVRRYELLEDDGLAFMPLYAYERSHGNTADHNVISLRDDMLRPHTYPVPEFWTELDGDTMTIPHQPIRRDTWNYQNDRLRPLVEIFQGCRDQSIEEDVHEGLARGYRLGFIASSDHMSTSASYACVWAAEPTRESIFRAMQARRTFGATDKIWLAVWSGDQWMGEVLEGGERRLSLRVQGTAPIRTIQLVVDGAVHHSWNGDGADMELEHTLDGNGARYAYFHLRQVDGNEAWSSPVWFATREE